MADNIKQLIAPLGVASAMPVTPCNEVKRLSSNPDSFGLRSSFVASGRYKAEVALIALAEARAKDEAAHTANLPAIEHNERMRALITAVMEAAGVAATYREPDPRSRAMVPKRITRDAGYIGDLRRAFVTSDGWDDACRAYDQRLSVFTEYKAKVEKEAEQRRATIEAEEAACKAKRAADIDLAKILIRYDLGAEVDDAGVLEVIRGRDRYLDLAMAMRQVRGDWSEGCDKVSDALGRFRGKMDATSAQDVEIVTDVAGAICSFADCQDGRVFRDTTWNYDKLFALADQQIVADAEVIEVRLQP